MGLKAIGLKAKYGLTRSLIEVKLFQTNFDSMTLVVHG
jgi:hypothetical protein